MKYVIKNCVARLKAEDDGTLTIIKKILKEEIEKYKTETNIDLMDRWYYIWDLVIYKYYRG